MRIHPHLGVDINKEKIIKYGHQIETSGDTGRQIMTVQALWHDVSNK